MGSKRLRRKKLKFKKLEKFHKLRTHKQKKNIFIKSYNGDEYEVNLQEKNIIDNRLSPKKCSRSCVEENNISDLKYFSRIREDYFSFLQTVISDNCAFYDSVVTEEMLENLALALEHNALLACLQVDIYKKAMLHIIRDIKKSTEEKQIHKDVKKLLPDSVQEKTNDIDTKQIPANSPDVANYSRISTVTSIRNDENLLNNESTWTEQESYNSGLYYSVPEHCNERENGTQVSSWSENEIYSSTLNHQNYWSTEVSQISESNLQSPINVISSEPSFVQNNFSDSDTKNNIPNVSDENEEKVEKFDPLLQSRNQLQKLVEQTLNETEKVNRQRRDEQERAYIAQILEGDDSLNDGLNDSLSDNENESKENIDESNLMDRLEKMRELFGVEDKDSETDFVPEKQKRTNKANHINIHGRRTTIWRYEKYIQLHKYSIIAAEMTFERQKINQRNFIELFGKDSDEEHEAEYSSTEKYRLSCTERISSWVVKYLMPFYQEKRVLGRNVFKSLGHYISNAIVDKIQYPDEWTVKYFVSKFFPPRKKYVCDADILNFQLD